MKKQCKRRIYAKVNPLTYVLDGLKPIPKTALDKLRTRELCAIEAFAKGQATIQEWSDISSMLTISECMALGGIGPEALQACKTAQEELLSAARRFESTGRMGATGAGIQAFRDLYEYADLQRTSITLAEFEHWVTKSYKRQQSGSPEVVEC